MATTATRQLLPPLLLLLFLTASPPTASSSPTLSVSPPALAKSGDAALIQWSGVDSPSSLDWLGIYSPPDSPDDAFLGYLFLSSCSSWRSGSCSLRLPLYNLRSDYQFRIFRWTESEVDPGRVDHDHNPLPRTKNILARSADLRFPAAAPEQVHLAYTDANDEMRVVFVAGDGSERFVKYGREREGLGRVVRAEVRRYERSDVCDQPANGSGWRDPGYVHDGVMKNLKEGKRYYYKVSFFLHT